jgi:hypothetical protein
MGIKQLTKVIGDAAPDAIKVNVLLLPPTVFFASCARLVAPRDRLLLA